MVKELVMAVITTVTTMFGVNPTIIEALSANTEQTIEFASKKIELTTGNEDHLHTLVSHLEYIEEYIDDLDISFKIISSENMKEISKENKLPTFAGLYNSKNNEVLIVEQDKEGSVHEVAHAIYFQKLSGDEIDAVNALFNIEANKLLDKYGTVSAEEFFAVAFTEYIYAPELLEKNAPNTFEFMENIKEYFI